MAIQGTQVPMYTKHTIFVFFRFFNFFFFVFYFYENQKQTNKNMLNKAQHKTRLTQGTREQNTQVMHKQKEGEREKMTKSL